MPTVRFRCAFAAGLVALLLVRAEARADEVPANAVLAVLPFLDASEPNRIVVDLAPEGSAKPLRLMLDTGSSESVLTPLAARELGVSVRSQKEERYRRPTRLGRDLLFRVETRGSDTGSKTGWEYGYVGGNFLTEYVVELDFPGHRVRLFDSKLYSLPTAGAAPEEAVLPIRVVGNTPSLEVAVNGTKSLILLGTGIPWSAVLDGRVAKSAGLTSEAIAGLTAASVVGPVDVELAVARRLALGPFEFADVPLLVAPKGWYNLVGTTNSTIGYDLLSQFVVRIDYAHERVWLKRDPEARLTFLGADVAVFQESGLLLIPKRGAFYAYIVQPDSAGAKRGLRQADVIEGMPSAAAIAKTLREGDELTVVRTKNGVGVETLLEALAMPTAQSDPARHP